MDTRRATTARPGSFTRRVPRRSGARRLRRRSTRLQSAIGGPAHAAAAGARRRPRRADTATSSCSRSSGSNLRPVVGHIRAGHPRRQPPQTERRRPWSPVDGERDSRPPSTTTGRYFSPGEFVARRDHGGCPPRRGRNLVRWPVEHAAPWPPAAETAPGRCCLKLVVGPAVALARWRYRADR